MSKVLMINGSPRENGNTKLALKEVAKTLNEEGIETVIVDIGKKAMQGCIACGWCGRMGKCTFSDIATCNSSQLHPSWFVEEVEPQQLSSASTSISPSSTCLLFPRNTGTWYMDKHLGRHNSTKKVCKPCVHLVATWHG